MNLNTIVEVMNTAQVIGRPSSGAPVLRFGRRHWCFRSAVRPTPWYSHQLGWPALTVDAGGLETRNLSRSSSCTDVKGPQECGRSQWFDKCIDRSWIVQDLEKQRRRRQAVCMSSPAGAMIP